MRELMRSLLAERFKLAIHEETKEMPVAALALIHDGKLGPTIQPHPAFDVNNEFSRSQSNDPEDLPFEEALKQQLGMKLLPQKAPQKVMVLDHVERPTEN